MNLICGINPVLEALASGTRHFDRLLIVKGLRNRRVTEAIRRATQLGVPLRFEKRETLDRWAGGVPHQGIMAVVSAKPLLSLDALVEKLREPALLVALDGVEDPRNLGAILRTSEAAGVDGVLLPERRSAGLSETVARASAGALEHVPVARVGNLVPALETLKARGLWAIGFDAQGGERWDSVDLRRPVILVLGGESRGIRRLVREHCDQIVSIPQFGHVSSLNVSVVAGIALFEAIRQRGSVPSQVRPIRTTNSHEAASHLVGPALDDEEADPGLEPRPPAADGDEDEDPLAGRATLAELEVHEDVAWAAGPTLLKPVEFMRGPGRHRRRRPGGPPRQAPPAPAAGSDVPVHQAAHGGRRRRRRRRRGGGEPHAAPSMAGPGGERGLESGAGVAPGAVEEGGDPGGDGHRGRRRRRRRRRR